MLPQANESLKSSGPDLSPIQKNALDAVSAMFNRATEVDPAAPIIEDKKTQLEPPLPSRGALQDCEFGMMLLLIRKWRGDELFTTINSSSFEMVVVALVKRTINRTLEPLEIDEGGGGDRDAFFSGEPYSKHIGAAKYSANLDAAMITVAFLALAVEQFNESLSGVDHEIQSAKLPNWVKSWRDATLFVILEGLKYAMECRVINDGNFHGFTCDPETNKEHPEDGNLKPQDRLFFTWTACETINDLTEWNESYLNGIAAAQLPEQAVTLLKSLITELELTLRKSADWCATEFFEEFKNLEAKDPKELVKNVNLLKGKRLSDQQRQDIAELGHCVQYVYQLSQYAAIRSLMPKSMSIQEVRTILDKIDLLVSRSIIASGLDESDQRDLFLTLTRKYSSGKWALYTDDAWYPLVVRSLAGLLSRTLRDIAEDSSKSEVLALTLTFERTLENHVTNLIDRRPSGSENKALWSFAPGQPYVLYATQRTIYALMRYEEFLVEVEEFKVDIFTEREPVPESEADLSTVLARKLAEGYLQPMISQVLAKLSSTQLREFSVNVGTQSNVSLPEEPWAENVIRNWLVEFKDTFEQARVKGSLSEKANWLRLIRECVEKYEPTKDLPERKRKGVDEQLVRLKEEYKKICMLKPVGGELQKQSEWGVEELTPILFDYLFRNCVQRATGSIEELSKNSTELWKLIKDAIDIRDNIKNLDPTGVP